VRQLHGDTSVLSDVNTRQCGGFRPVCPSHSGALADDSDQKIYGKNIFVSAEKSTGRVHWMFATHTLISMFTSCELIFDKSSIVGTENMNHMPRLAIQTLSLCM
jgi:hypothetical protein